MTTHTAADRDTTPDECHGNIMSRHRHGIFPPKSILLFLVQLLDKASPHCENHAKLQKNHKTKKSYTANFQTLSP